jgi:predicted LPLAT superfamily acyltransferase
MGLFFDAIKEISKLPESERATVLQAAVENHERTNVAER